MCARAALAGPGLAGSAGPGYRCRPGTAPPWPRWLALARWLAIGAAPAGLRLESWRRAGAIAPALADAALRQEKSS